MSACRSCGALIRWAVTENGKRIPLDADPVVIVPRGAFRISGRTYVEALPGGDLEDSKIASSVTAEPLYLSHFATCPNAATHRKGKT